MQTANISRIKAGTVLLPGLRRLREGKDLSIRDLGKKAGVAADTVWRLETLQRGAESKTRRKLARALGTTVRDLRTSDEEVDET